MKGTIGKAILAALFINVTHSSADLGWYGDSPGHITLEGEEHASIVLKNEVVSLELDDGGAAFGGIDLKGCFEFQNDGPTTGVIMAYPLYEDALPVNSWHDEFAVERGVSKEHPVNHRVFTRIALDTAQFRSGFDSRIKDYRDIEITVDGAEVEAAFVFRYSLESDAVKTNRYVRWPVDFAAGETKRVEIAFRNPFERKGGYGASWYHYNFEYPLYTGRTWAGPIGNGTIKVFYDEDNVGGPIFFQSPGCPVAHVVSDDGKTEITWAWRDFEPPENARIKITKGAPGHFLQPTIVSYCRQIGLEVDGEPAIALNEGITLRAEPAENAAVVGENREFPLRTPMAVKSSRGEWWYVKLNDGTEGWLRWREVDPDTDEERLNAAFAYYLTE